MPSDKPPTESLFNHFPLKPSATAIEAEESLA